MSRYWDGEGTIQVDTLRVASGDVVSAAALGSGTGYVVAIQSDGTGSVVWDDGGTDICALEASAGEGPLVFQQGSQPKFTTDLAITITGAASVTTHYYIR